MPKFRYKVELADGTIAKRTSFREYTHLIEISPQSIEGAIADFDQNIARLQEDWERYNKTPEEIERERQTEILMETTRIRAWDFLSDEQKNERCQSTIEWSGRRHSVEQYAENRESLETRIKDVTARKEALIAEGHETIGNYFASNWCGSYDLALKKVNSRDVRYWTDRGHKARIVRTPLGQ